VAQVAADQITSGVAAPAPGEPSQAVVGRSPWELFWRRFRQDRFALVGIVFIVLLIILAIMAPLFSEYVVHHGKNELFIYQVLDEYGLPKGPNAEFWFGSDPTGRDLFVRVLYGARTSLIVAFFATGIAMVLGVVLGVTAGFYRGKVDGSFHSRMVRGNLMETMSEDYIRTARAKGLSERKVILKHGLRSALTPVVTMFGLDVAFLLGGAVVTETVFQLPGLGQYAITALTVNDFPPVMGVTVFGALFIVVANLLVDIAYAFLDPRVRYA